MRISSPQLGYDFGLRPLYSLALRLAHLGPQHFACPRSTADLAGGTEHNRIPNLTLQLMVASEAIARARRMGEAWSPARSGRASTSPQSSREARARAHGVHLRHAAPRHPGRRVRFQHRRLWPDLRTRSLGGLRPPGRIGTNSSRDVLIWRSSMRDMRECGAGCLRSTFEVWTRCVFEVRARARRARRSGAALAAPAGEPAGCVLAGVDRHAQPQPQPQLEQGEGAEPRQAKVRLRLGEFGWGSPRIGSRQASRSSPWTTARLHRPGSCPLITTMGAHLHGSLSGAISLDSHHGPYPELSIRP